MRSKNFSQSGWRGGGLVVLLDDGLVELLLGLLGELRAAELHEAAVDAQHTEHLDLLRREHRVAVGDDEVGCRHPPVDVNEPLMNSS